MNLRGTLRTSVVGAAVAGTLVVLAGPALAVHPELSGTVQCAAGEQIVSWTVSNSESTSDSNRAMTVTGISVSSGTVTGVAVGAVLPPTPAAGSTLVATTVLPGDQTGSVELTVRADWDTGDWEDGARTGIVRSVAVTLAGGCAGATTSTTSTTTTSSTTTTTTAAPLVGGVTEARAPVPLPATAPATLPATGSPAALLAATGAGLLGAGMMLRRFRRTR